MMYRLPTGVVGEAVTVIVLLPVVGLGEKEAVAPLGTPETARLTALVKPFCGKTVTCPVALLPCPTSNAMPGTLRVKVGA